MVVGVGGAWSIPLNPDAPGSWRDGRARQDIAGALLLQPQWRQFFLQLELLGGGISAAQPEFFSGAVRAGVFLPMAPVRAYVALGAAWATMSGKSGYECFNYGCDPKDGSGFAISGELGVQFPGWGEGALAPFVQILLPTFGVATTGYCCDGGSSVQLLLVGARLLF